MISIAHRGASGHEPENTLRAVRRAVALGAARVEVDVHAVEGELVVIHDDRLERTTDGRGRVRDATLAYLRSLDAGKGERIPTLAEVFDALAGEAELIVELKGAGTDALVADFVRARRPRDGRSDTILVSSFDHRALRRLRALDPGIRVGALLVGLPETNAAFAEALGAESVHPSVDFIDEAFVADAHRRGLAVLPFTANDPDEIARMGRLGADGVFTDYPERVAAAGR